MEVVVVSTGLLPLVILAWLIVAKLTHGGSSSSSSNSSSQDRLDNRSSAGNMLTAHSEQPKALMNHPMNDDDSEVPSPVPSQQHHITHPEPCDQDERANDMVVMGKGSTALGTSGGISDCNGSEDRACLTPSSFKRLSSRQRKKNRKRDREERTKYVNTGANYSTSWSGLMSGPGVSSSSSCMISSAKLVGSSKQVKKRISRQYEDLGLTDSQIYHCLLHYTIQKHQLRRLGFPMESELHPGKAYVYQDPEFGCKIVGDMDDDLYECDPPQARPPRSSSMLDVNAREFYPSPTSTSSSPSSTSSWSKSGSANGGSDCLFHPTLTSGSVLSPSAKEFVPMSHVESNASCNTLELQQPQPQNDSVILELSSNEGGEAKQCARCSKMFFVTENGEPLSPNPCSYHWGKLRARRREDAACSSSSSSYHVDQYTCCGAKASDAWKGCCRCSTHVWRNFMESGMHGPLDGFVKTRLRKLSPVDGNFGIYAMDGEMCFTTQGLELIKLTVVGIDGRLVYESLILPEGQVVDYNTRFSGISCRDLKRGPAKSLREVQNDVMGFLNENSILIGHSLENDLRALKLIHATIIDTSLVFPHYYGLPYRRSLKSLAGSYLKHDIQTASWGHDSYEDARACLELMLWKVSRDWPLFATEKQDDPTFRPPTSSLKHPTAQQHNSSTMSTSSLPSSSSYSYAAVACSTVLTTSKATSRTQTTV